MKQSVYENIRQMDLSLGGGLISEQTRIEMINHPVLAIGLGGTGTDALLRLKAQVQRRFILNPLVRKHKPDNIEFLALETNEHDHKKYRGMGLDAHQELVLLSNAGIGAILNNRSTLPDYIKDWLAPELTISDGTKGASGNRQAGRLLMFEKINSVIDAIDNKIRALRPERGNKLLVFILTGLSGGTGGGMFLDVAYIVRGLMERDYGAKGIDRVEISGYLFTPDVHIAGNTLNIHTEEYIQRNGYAALKELDYWMNIEERAGERFCQRYGTRLTVNSALPPFNLCHLVSAANTDGVYVKNAYTHCIGVTAENIVNFLAAEEKTTGEFAIHDYQSNLLANIAAMKSGLPDGTDHSANYTYNIIGAAAAVLPAAEINAYLAHRVFLEMGGLFDAFPTAHDLNECTRHTGLEPAQAEADLARRLPPLTLDYAETDFYSYHNVIKTRRVNIDEKLSALYEQAKAALGEAKREAVAYIEKAKTALQEAFANPKQGPIFVARLIESDTNPCLLPWLETCITHLCEKQAQASEEIEAHALSAENCFEAAQKALLFTRESKKNAYIAAKVRKYQAHLRKDCYGWLANLYRAFHAALQTENDDFYAPLADALQEVRRVLAKNGAFLGEGKRITDGTGFGWHIIGTADAAGEIDVLVREAGTETLTKNFTRSLTHDADRWLKENRLDIPGAMSDFLYSQFGSVINRSIEDYLCENNGRTIDEIIETDIAPRLYRDALPIFHLDNAVGLYNFPSFGMVSVPNNAPNLLRGIERHQQSALASLKFNIHRSKITDRIFWLNTQNGIPLFAYTPIRVYETLYESTILGKEGVGRHLVMSERENWANLPSPLPEGLWGDTYFNARQKESNDRARGIFYQALKLGNIEMRPEASNSRYVAVLHADFDAALYHFDENTNTCTLHDLIQRLQPIKNSGLPILEKRPFHNSPTEALALAHFLRNPKLIEAVRKENDKMAQVNDILQRLSALQSTREQEKTAYDDILTALACEAITKQNGAFLYNSDPGEERWKPLVNLLEQADYPEFTLFAAYQALSPNKKERIKKRSSYNRIHFPDGKLLLNLRKWQGTFGLRKETMDNERVPTDTAVYAFYTNILQRANTHVAALV